MNYRVRITSSAEREMDRLPRTTHTRINRRILSLGTDPRPRGTKKLSGREEYRLRIGDYRVFYTIDDNSLTVVVLAVRHRREAYR